MALRSFARASLLAAVLVTTASAPARAAGAVQECAADLEVLPGYLLDNDTGAPEHVKRKGRAVLDQALDTARQAAASIGNEADCLPVLRAYLRTYRSGHLSVVPTTPPPNAEPNPAQRNAKRGAAIDPLAPRFRVLSSRTALITADSFADPYGPAMAALVGRNARAIAARANLIIDVRRNGGGSDSTYAPLLPLLDANPRSDVAAEFLATPANIAATEQACAFFAPGAPTCSDFMQPVLRAMRAARPGDYVLPVGAQRVETIVPQRVLRHPQRVALMIDRHCASSCEEFVLAARQSFKVKLFGRSTHGSLDYSNLRPYRLPSGKRVLLYATSRSLRLPHAPVDTAGIAPDQILPPPLDDTGYDAEVQQVRRLVEAAR